VAIYAAGEVDLGNYLAYLYTGITIEGTVAFQVADVGSRSRRGTTRRDSCGTMGTS